MEEKERRITKIDFIKGVVSEEAILYDGIPQVAFIGRSNVGKSTLMNVLMERKGMVKTGRTPGKTKEINFFLVQWKEKEGDVREAYFVDLPGYGYARVSKGMREALQQRISWYLTHPVSDLALVVLIIDARRGLGEEDRAIIETLRERGEVFLVVNKIDKLNQKELHQLKKTLKEDALIADIPRYFISAVKKKHTHLLQKDIFTKMSNVS